MRVLWFPITLLLVIPLGARAQTQPDGCVLDLHVPVSSDKPFVCTLPVDQAATRLWCLVSPAHPRLTLTVTTPANGTTEYEGELGRAVAKDHPKPGVWRLTVHSTDHAVQRVHIQATLAGGQRYAHLEGWTNDSRYPPESEIPLSIRFTGAAPPPGTKIPVTVWRPDLRESKAKPPDRSKADTTHIYRKSNRVTLRDDGRWNDPVGADGHYQGRSFRETNSSGLYLIDFVFPVSLEGGKPVYRRIRQSFEVGEAAIPSALARLFHDLALLDQQSRHKNVRQ